MTFGVDQAISGLSLNLLAAGLTRFLSTITFATVAGRLDHDVAAGARLRRPSACPASTPLLAPVDRANVPIISDAAAVVLGLLTDVSVLTIAVVALVPLDLVGPLANAARAPDPGGGGAARGCRQPRRPAVALPLSSPSGVSGGLAGLGGVYLVTVASSLYREGQTAGRGFIGLATVIFGNWNPWSVTVGSLIFGFTDALRTRQEVTVGVLLVGLGMLGARRRDPARPRSRLARSGPVRGPGRGHARLVLVVRDVPAEFVSFAPHLTTLLVLAFARQRLRPPAAIGEPFRRGDST